MPAAIAVRPGWAGPPAQRQAPPAPRPPQHPMQQTYPPQGNTMPPPHLPPQVGMPAGCTTVFVSKLIHNTVLLRQHNLVLTLYQF